jgi:hypothetical protein
MEGLSCDWWACGLRCRVPCRENLIEGESLAGILTFVFDHKYVLMLFKTNNFTSL